MHEARAECAVQFVSFSRVFPSCFWLAIGVGSGYYLSRPDRPLRVLRRGASRAPSEILDPVLDIVDMLGGGCLPDLAEEIPFREHDSFAPLARWTRLDFDFCDIMAAAEVFTGIDPIIVVYVLDQR